jgi:transposase
LELTEERRKGDTVGAFFRFWGSAMSYIPGASRHQVEMFAECLDDYVGEENPIRVLDAFVEQLDVKACGFDKAEVCDVGRKPYNPRCLLKLYLWGYLNRVTSSRRLEVETHRNLEVKWLLGNLTPDDKTISNFRKDSKKPLKEVFVQFRVLSKSLDLLSSKGEVAIDGSKFKGQNSSKRNLTADNLQQRIEDLRKEAAEYLEQIEANDVADMALPKESIAEIQTRIATLKERMENYQALLATVQEQGESQISLTDADSRAMVQSGSKGKVVGYNVQTVVDAKHSLIVEFEPTSAPNDMQQLHRQVVKAKESLGVESLEVTVDAGYHNAAELTKCEQVEGVTIYAAPKASSAKKNSTVPTPEYSLDQFSYDENKDEYRCPQGVALVKIGAVQATDGSVSTRYGTPSCKHCSVRSKCTTNKQGRIIQRSAYQGAVERNQTRVKNNPEKTKRRGQTIEPVFGTIKNRGQGVFLTKGIASVGAEFALSALAYNFTRMVKILGVAALLKALAPQTA